MKKEFGKQFKHPKRNEILKYISLLYSKSSKLNNIENLIERKKIASEQSGLNDVDVVEITKSKEINMLIIDFLTENASNKYALLAIKQDLFWKMLSLLQEPLKDTIDIEELQNSIKFKNMLVGFCDDLEVSCEKMYGEIYRSDMKDVAMEMMIKSVVRPEERLKKN